MERAEAILPVRKVVHNDTEKTFQVSVIDCGLKYSSSEPNDDACPASRRPAPNYVPLEDWYCINQIKRRARWYQAMVELNTYLPQDMEVLGGYINKKNSEMKSAIKWMFVYTVILLFLNHFGCSSLWELIF